MLNKRRSRAVQHDCNCLYSKTLSVNLEYGSNDLTFSASDSRLSLNLCENGFISIISWVFAANTKIGLKIFEVAYLLKCLGSNFVPPLCNVFRLLEATFEVRQ